MCEGGGEDKHFYVDVGKLFFLQGGGKTFYDEEMYVSESNFVENKANILMRIVSKLTAGARIVKGPSGPKNSSTFMIQLKYPKLLEVLIVISIMYQ